MKPFHALLLAVALTPAGILALQARPTAQARPSGPIAFVGMQRVLTESAAAKAAAARLDELRKAKAQEIAGKKKALDETKLALANAGGIFSGTKRAELKSTEQRQEAELRQATEDAQKAFTDLQHEVQAALRKDLGRVITDVARER